MSATFGMWQFRKELEQATTEEERQEILAKYKSQATTLEAAKVEEKISFNQLVMILAILKLAKMPGGMPLIKDLGKEFIKGIFDALHALGQASAGNKVAAWANPYLFSMVLHRFGFVTDFDLVQFRVGLSIITGAGIAEGFIDTIAGVFPFSKPEPSEFPSQVVMSARAAGVELPETMTYDQLTDLMRAMPRAPALPKKRKEK